jgi:hypothetical protein
MGFLWDILDLKPRQSFECKVAGQEQESIRIAMRKNRIENGVFHFFPTPYQQSVDATQPV